MHSNHGFSLKHSKSNSSTSSIPAAASACTTSNQCQASTTVTSTNNNNDTTNNNLCTGTNKNINHNNKSKSHGYGQQQQRRRNHFSQDDLGLGTPSIELISRAARRWQSNTSTPLHPQSVTSSSSASAATSKSKLHSTLYDADYSEVVMATDQVRTALQEGAAVAKRPPRAGVSGTYFLCGDGDGPAFGVFKPMDEEAQSIDMSPSPPPRSIPSSLPNLPLDCLEMLGPAHGGGTFSSMFQPASPPPSMLSGSPPPGTYGYGGRSSPLFCRGGSGSSESEGNESRVTLCRANANGFHPGEGAYREVAAYILDHERFAGVPQTALLQWDKPYSDIMDNDCYDDDDHPDHPDRAGEDAAVQAGHGEDEENFGEGTTFGNINNKCGHDPDEGSTGTAATSGSYLSQSEESFSESDIYVDGNCLSDEQSDLSSGDEFEGATSAYSTSTARIGKNIQTKKGAFQVFVPNKGDTDDFGPGVFDKDQVHRIAVLDIRTVNHDRHGGNILVKEASSVSSPSAWSSSTFSSSSCSASSASGAPVDSNRREEKKRRYDLVPIDHGYILPDRIQNVPWPVWMDWPMIKEALSEEARQYIQYLDAESDVRKLTQEMKDVFRPGALQSLKIATTLLKKGVAAGMTLFEIGCMMYTRRDEPHGRSELEKIVSEAEESSLARDRHIAEQRLREEAAMGIGMDIGGGAQTGESGNGAAPGMPRRHQRHQSSNAIVGGVWGGEQTFVDEYVVKYASRRIQEAVNRYISDKMKKSKSDRASIGNNGDGGNGNGYNGGGGVGVGLNNKSGNGVGGFAGGKLDFDSRGGLSSSVGGFGGRGPRGLVGSGRPSYLTRARSIPDFGIGEKPVQVILKQRAVENGRANGSGSARPMPTPASSPLAVRSSMCVGTVPSATMSRAIPPPIPSKGKLKQTPLCTSVQMTSGGGGGGGMVSAPIQIPINDERVKRIALPMIPFKASKASSTTSTVGSSDSSGRMMIGNWSNASAAATGSGSSDTKATGSGSSDTNGRGKGERGENDMGGVGSKVVVDNDMVKEGDEDVGCTTCATLCNDSSGESSVPSKLLSLRDKSSPVSPMDLFKWDSRLARR